METQDPIIPDTQEAPSNIIINGEEYSPEDAQALIETGKKTREAEKNWNTSLDRVWPEYGRLTGERSTWEKEKAELTAKLQQYEAKKEAGTETNVDVQQAKEAARKLGLTLNEDLEKSGYVKKDDLDNYLSERERKNNEVKTVLEEADKYEKEINGEDGRPKFNKKMVLAWANSYGIPDLMTAYKDMHKDVLTEWEQSQVNAKKGASLKTLKPGGAKQVPEGKVDDNNVKDLLKETLWGSKG